MRSVRIFKNSGVDKAFFIRWWIFFFIWIFYHTGVISARKVVSWPLPVTRLELSSPRLKSRACRGGASNHKLQAASPPVCNPRGYLLKRGKGISGAPGRSRTCIWPLGGVCSLRWTTRASLKPYPAYPTLKSRACRGTKGELSLEDSNYILLIPLVFVISSLARNLRSSILLFIIGGFCIEDSLVKYWWRYK